MENIYLEYAFTVDPVTPTTDILMAELGELGFESFVETDTGALAYIKKEDSELLALDTLYVMQQPKVSINYRIKEIPQENWNAVWEENFDPIQVGKECVVRASFHKKPEVRYDIVITPKMSFGTGHHETTHMMLQYVLNEDVKGKSVLDMGSGTGVLGILAAMKGAISVDAIDIDHWCYLNALENVARNNCHMVQVLEGDIGLLKEQKYDLILANINRNILLSDIPVYASCLNRGGHLIVSGFYAEDLSMISQECQASRLKFENNSEKNNWVAAKYVF